MRRTPAWRALVAAQLRVVLALAVGYDRRPWAAAGRRFGREVRIEESELGGIPATVFTPGRRGPWPGVLVLPGVTRRGRRHPAFVGAGRGLAAAGFVTAVIEPPGLAVGELTPSTVDRAAAAAVDLLEHGDVRGGRIGLAGVSGGATIALVLAGRAALANRVSVVAALAPCCDTRAALQLVTTDRYPRDGELVPFRTGGFFRLVLARSAVAWLADGPDRDVLRSHLLALDDDEEDPLRELRRWPRAGLGGDARAIVDLLGNVDPARFDQLFAALTDTQREAARALSPIAFADDVSAPVELVVAREDKYIPFADAIGFAEACPGVRVTVIESLEHAVPRVSPDAARDLARLDGVALRFLATSYSR